MGQSATLNEPTHNIAVPMVDVPSRPRCATLSRPTDRGQLPPAHRQPSEDPLEECISTNADGTTREAARATVKLPESVCLDRTSCTTAWPLDSHPIAVRLARVANVVDVYVSGSRDMPQIWTVLSKNDDATLAAVFERELELHDDYGERLASVEFYVVSQDAARLFALGEKIPVSAG